MTHQTHGVARVAPASTTPDAEWQLGMSAFVEKCRARLWAATPTAQKVLGYVRQQRGLTETTIQAAGLGYNPSWHAIPYRGSLLQAVPGLVIPGYHNGNLSSVKIRSRVGSFAAAMGWKD